jgi:hypothetical protein
MAVPSLISFEGRVYEIGVLYAAERETADALRGHPDPSHLLALKHRQGMRLELDYNGSVAFDRPVTQPQQ